MAAPLQFHANDELVNRVERYFTTHPEMDREMFLRDALRRELNALDRPVIRERPSKEEIRNHAWIEEGLAAVRHERHGLWNRMRNYFKG